MNVDWQHDTAPLPAAVLADFPGAASIFDTAAVAHTLLAAGALDPETARDGLAVENVWYIPGRALRVVYACRRGEPGGPRILSVDFSRGGPADPAAGGTPVPEWQAVACRFPADRALHGLPDLVDAAAISARLSAALGTGVPGASMRWSLLSYLPGERAALRLRWPQAGADVVAKLDASAAASHARMDALWRDPARRFGMAEPLLALPDLPARCERFVVGERLEALAARAAGPTGTLEARDALLRPVMNGLVALHGSRLSGLARKPAEELLRRVQRKVLPRIAVALPELAPRAAALVEVLAATVPPPGPPRVLHGDLHTANLLLDEDGRVVFIDLDSLCLGDPALDLAQLGTRLALGEARAGNAPAMLAAAGRLPALYAAAGGEAPDARTYAWYVAMLLVGRQIKTCIRHLAPELPTLAERLLDAAEAVWREGALVSGTGGAREKATVA